MVGKVQILVVVVAVVVVVGVMAFLFIPQGEGDDGYYAPWPMFGGNPQHNGRSPYLADSPPFELEWTLEFDGFCHIMTMGWDKTLLAVNPDGSVKWNASLARGASHWGMSFTPIIGNDDTIYVHNDEDAIVAVGSEGNILWQFPVDVNCFACAIGQDGTIYISENGFEGQFSYIHAVNPNGELDWTYKIFDGTMISSIVTCNDGTILFSCWDGIYALNQDGKKKWWYDVQGLAGSIVIGEEGTLYFMVWDFEAAATTMYAIS
ncbi:MAG: PQQ-like beta-propeller repeat protein [Methanomassiliicoccales archaeon]|nr:PQQ-like beta-propeller repeat protein [Methanomassiliicoccales archaeon]